MIRLPQCINPSKFKEDMEIIGVLVYDMAEFYPPGFNAPQHNIIRVTWGRESVERVTKAAEIIGNYLSQHSQQQ